MKHLRKHGTDLNWQTAARMTAQYRMLKKKDPHYRKLAAKLTMAR